MASFLSTLAENIKALPQMARDIGRNILGSPLGRTLGYSPTQTTPTVTTPAPTGGGVRVPTTTTTGGITALTTTPATTPSGLTAQADEALKDQISNQIIELLDKLANIPGVHLSDEEREAFLQKAIAQVSPYYDKKKAEIEKSIETGKIRSAEDVLLTIRDVVQEAEDLLKRYDIEEARTEEEFVNTMADITATEGESLDTLRYNWKERVKKVKQGQIEAGVLTSGIGMKEVREMLARQSEEEAAVQRRAGQARTEATTAQKYDLQKISAAREEVERERVRRIGGPTEEAATTTAALERAGLGGMAELPSYAEIARRRGEEPYTQYKPEALTELSEERKRAEESRKLQLEAEERAVREQEEYRQRQLIESQLAKKQAEMQRYLYT